MLEREVITGLTAVRAVRAAYQDGCEAERQRVEWILARFETALSSHDEGIGQNARLTIKIFREIWEGKR